VRVAAIFAADTNAGCIGRWCWSMKGEDEDRYTEGETARRRDEVTRRIINTPPQPRRAPTPKVRPPSKGQVHKGKARD
jgi:hypothetical protein